MIPWIIPILIAVALAWIVFRLGMIYGIGTHTPEPCNRKHRDEL